MASRYTCDPRNRGYGYRHAAWLKARGAPSPFAHNGPSCEPWPKAGVPESTRGYLALASHAEVPFARELGSGYTAGTVQLARKLLAENA